MIEDVASDERVLDLLATQIMFQLSFWSLKYVPGVVGKGSLAYYVFLYLMSRDVDDVMTF